MKKQSLLFLSLLWLLLLANCKKSEPPTAEQVQMGLLAKTWKAKAVTLNGYSVQADYASFSLALASDATTNAYTYTCSGRPANSPWKPSGTWQFGSPVQSQIKRDDGITITYTATATTLRMEFSLTGAGYPARAESVEGNWVFEFTP